MDLPFSIEQLETYILILIRSAAIIFSMPIFGSSELPRSVKAGLAATVAWIVAPAVGIPAELGSVSLLGLVPAVTAEIMVGVLIGLCTRIIFEGVQLSGQLVGFQMGFGIVNVMDPVTGQNFSIIAQFQNLLALLLFMGLNLHHLFFKAIVVSFDKIPLLHSYLSLQLLQWFGSLTSNIFLVAVKIGAPIIALNIFVSLTVGLVNKAAPQMHIMIVAFPVKIAAGLFAVGFTMPMFCFTIKRLFPKVGEYMTMVISMGHSP